jgi:hypothetical protein
MKDKLGDNIVFFDVQPLFNHLTYLYPNRSFSRKYQYDFFIKDKMALLNHYNGKCDDSTLYSQFVVGNQKCLEQNKK